MLRPLLVLFALTAVPGAVGQTTFSENRELDISSCPITYFGQTYDRVFATFTDTNFVICFNGFYDPATSTDCIIAPKAGPEASFEISDQSRLLEILIQNDPDVSIPRHLDCFVSIGLGNEFAIYLVKFGQEAVVGLNSNVGGTTLADIMVNGITVDTLSVTNTMSNGQFYDFADVSGCRHRGVVYRTNTTTVIPEFCETVQCSDTAVLDVTTCGPTETCLGNNMCVTTTTTTTTTTLPPPSKFLCTVAGFTVFAFSSQIVFIRYRCDYYLLRIPGFSVVGSFRSLFSVILKVNGVHVRLEQGGTVRVGNRPLNLRSPQVVHGVQLSKDQTGVTAIVHIEQIKIIIIMNFYSVKIFVEVIHVEVFTGLSLQGLCQTSSSEALLPNCGSTRWYRR